MSAFLMVDYILPEAIKQLHQQIDPEDLYIEDNPQSSLTYGLETEPHVTVAPCLRNNVALNNVKKFLRPLKEYRLELTELDVFDNPIKDVLVCHVKYCATLFETNAEISEHYKLRNRYEFNPHVTVASLKRGKGQKYKSLPLPKGVVVEPKCFSYSRSEGKNQVKEVFGE
jgi:hypothetical protein